MLIESISIYKKTNREDSTALLMVTLVYIITEFLYTTFLFLSK